MELAFESLGYLVLIATLGGILYAFYWFFKYMLDGIKKNDEYDD